MKAKQILAERTLGRFLPKTITWDSAVEEYIAVCEHKTRARTSKEYRRSLKCHFGFGSTRLADITKHEIARKLDKLHETPSQQRHALIYVRMFFKWAQGGTTSNTIRAPRRLHRGRYRALASSPMTSCAECG